MNGKIIIILRYKCIGLNRAGNQSVEFILRVQRKPQAPSDSQAAQLAPSGSARDQRANSLANGGNLASSSKSNQETKALASQASNSNVYEQKSQVFRHIQQQSASSQWLKGSFTFQFVMVFVSVLMAGVIVAFVVFCIAIYRIKPSGNPPAFRSQTNGLDPSTGQPTTPTTNSTQNSYWPLLSLRKASNVFSQNSPVVGGQRGIPPMLTAVCNPITGQTPVHLLASHSPHLEMSNQQVLANGFVNFPNGATNQRQHAQYYIKHSNHVEESGFANWPNGINGSYRTSPLPAIGVGGGNQAQYPPNQDAHYNHNTVPNLQQSHSNTTMNQHNNRIY